MHNIIFPLKDTTIYSKYPEINTGLDEILEITKEVSSSLYFYRGEWESSSYYKRYDYVISSSEYFFAVAENINEIPSQSSYWAGFNPTNINENSRILIKFDLTNFNVDALASASAVYLNLFTSIARKVPTEYTLIAYPITGSWEMGVGNFTDKLTTGGATWNRRNTTTNWNSVGGDIQASYFATQSFNFVPTDIRMDVTNMFNYWRASSSNEGILIQRTDEQEQNTTKYGSLSFYSLDTHTVYVPTLEIVYDDSIYNSSSFIASSSFSQSMALSSSFSSSVISLQAATISSSLTNYYSSSINEVSVSIVVDGTLPSGTVSYATQSTYINSILVDTASNAYYLSTSSLFTYYSASVVNTIINVVSGSIYISGSVINTPQSASFYYLSYTTQSFTTDTVIYTPVTSSIEIDTIADVTGSLISGSINISMKNFMPEYKYNEIAQFRINVKPSYVAKTFYEELRLAEIYYLPPNSLYYSIVDAYSNRIMIPFSNYTKVSLDSTGHFFNVSLSGFMPERFYKIIFKIVLNGEIQYFDPDSQFKVVK